MNEVVHTNIPKIGDVVTHASHKHGQLVGTIVSQHSSIRESRWNMEYPNGKHGTWMKKYCVLYNPAKDVTKEGAPKVFQGSNAITTPSPKINAYSQVSVFQQDMAAWCEMYGTRHDDKIEQCSQTSAIMQDMSALKWRLLHWKQEYFNNPNESEEDTMKLLIQDFTTINGVKSEQINTDGYLALITNAEAEVQRLVELQNGSEAIAKSAVIVNQIKELQAGIVRCVSMMDKQADKTTD